MRNLKGIYIHIPFCKYICTYCNFNKFYIQNQPVDEYIDCLVKEIDNIGNYDDVITIYIGGGTPSSLSFSQIIKLLEIIKKNINIDNIKEYTFEANPEDLTIEKIKILKKYGVNRVSIGVQTLNEDILKSIGRGHSKKDVDNAVKNLKKVGINNINIDLMFSLPNQTMLDLKKSIMEILSYDISHISCYSLILEQRTKLYNQVKKNKIILPDNEVELNMYKYVIKTLSENGFNQYEISNFSKKGFESIHNTNYWRNMEYYGVGAGAHGYINGVRYRNIASVKFYIDEINKKNNAIIEKNKLTLKEKVEEEFFLGLRLLKGVNLDNIDEKYHIDCRKIYKETILKHLSNGNLVLKDSILKFEYKGLLNGNDVFSDFIIL